MKKKILTKQINFKYFLTIKALEKFSDMKRSRSKKKVV
jgi:hypothetical protein